MEVTTVGGGTWSLADQSPENFTMVVFYLGLHCILSNSIFEVTRDGTFVRTILDNAALDALGVAIGDNGAEVFPVTNELVFTGDRGSVRGVLYAVDLVTLATRVFFDTGLGPITGIAFGPTGDMAIIDGFSTDKLRLYDFDGDGVFTPNIVINSVAGFESPVDGGPITVKKNRVIPFKVELQDASGNLITDLNIDAAPVIQVIFDPDVGMALDMTEDALAAGQGTDGNQFSYDDPVWQFNLKTKNYDAAGTYTVNIISGDDGGYVIDPSIEGSFVVLP